MTMKSGDIVRVSGEVGKWLVDEVIGNSFMANRILIRGVVDEQTRIFFMNEVAR